MMNAGLLTLIMKVLTSSFYESEEYFHILHFSEVNSFQRLFYFIRFYRSFATASYTLQNTEINIFNSISSETVLRGLIKENNIFLNKCDRKRYFYYKPRNCFIHSLRK